MIYCGKRVWLQEARKKANLTQFQIAQALGITPVYYQKIEYGERTPSMELASKIAKLLDFPIEKFAAD